MTEAEITADGRTNIRVRLEPSEQGPRNAQPDNSASEANDGREYENQCYESYVRQRASLIDSGREVSGRYDHWVLTISGGALALTLTFLEKIAPRPLPQTLIYVAGAWAFLLIALLAGFCAIITSQYSIDAEIKNLDRTRRSQSTHGEGVSHSNGFRTATHVLNFSSTGALVVGVVLLCVFAYKNITPASTASASVSATNTTNIPATTNLPGTVK